MKLVINDAYNMHGDTYGTYYIPEEIVEALGDDYVWREDHRFNSIFIDWVEKHKGNTTLKVVEMPDNATDYEIFEHDGWESVIAVVDGHIVHI